jgi:Zn-dependent alcohol dehydrogenase
MPAEVRHGCDCSNTPGAGTIGVAVAGQEISTRPFQLVTSAPGWALRSVARAGERMCRGSSFELMRRGESIRSVVVY